MFSVKFAGFLEVGGSQSTIGKKCVANFFPSTINYKLNGAIV